jgi:predicted nucleic acid-binding protein
MECLVGPFKRQDQGLVAVYRDIFDILEALPISDAAWELAAEMRATHGLIAPDALHLAVAELNGCDEFWTADTHFDRMVGKVQTRICLLQ